MLHLRSDMAESSHYSSSSSVSPSVSFRVMRMPYWRAPESTAWRIGAGRASGGWTPGSARGKCFMKSAAMCGVPPAMGEGYPSPAARLAQRWKRGVPAHDGTALALHAVHDDGERE